MKPLISLGLFVAMLIILFPTVQASTTVGYCQALSSDTIYVMNQSIIDTGNCFTMDGVSNITFNCSYYSIKEQWTDNDGFWINNSNDIFIENCNVTTYQRGVYIVNGTDITLDTFIIDKCQSYDIFVNASSGIYLNNIDDSPVKSGWETNGIDILDSEHIHINNVNITNKYAYHLGLTNTDHVTVTDYEANGSLYYSEKCIIVSGSMTNLTLTNIVCNNAPVDLDQVSNVHVDNMEISLQDSFRDNTWDNIRDSTFNNLWIHDSYDDGLELNHAKNLTFTNSNISNNADFGLYLTNSWEIYVSDSIFDSNNDDNIYIYGSVNTSSFDNITSSNSGDYGLYAQPCDDCNITNSNIIYNADDGIYLRDSLNSYVYNINVSYNDYGLFLHNSHGANIDIVNAIGNTGYYPLRIRSNNVTMSNMHSTGGQSCIVLSGQNINISDSVFRDASKYSDVMTSSSYCPTLTVSNITVTGNKPFILHKTTANIQNTDNIGQLVLCEADDSVIHNVTMKANQLDVLSSDNVTISNFYCNGCSNGVIISSSNATITDSTFNGTTTHDIVIGRNSNATINNITSTNTLGYFSMYLYGESISRNLNINCPKCEFSAIEVDKGTHTIHDSIIVGSHAGIITDKSNDAILNLNIYNTQISFVNNTADPLFGINDSISFYCGYYNPPYTYCNETTTHNLYNTTISTYLVNWTGSSLNRYWYLDVSNPLGATVVLKDAFGTTVDTFTDTSKSFALLQYVVIPTDNQTTYTPHSLDMTKDGYTSKSVYVTMDESGQYAVSLASISGFGATLTQAGAGLGGFLTAIQNPVINIVLALGVIGGILAIFYGIASVIKRATGGAVSSI